MIPGVNETAAGLRAGSAIVSAVKGSLGVDQWPNMHESLLALYAILDEWCAIGELTASKIDGERKRREDGAGSVPRWARRTNIQMEYLASTASPDMERLFEPDARIIMRWSRAERRAAARRGLHTTLSVYFPQLLLDFDRAVQDRKRFLAENDVAIKSGLSSLSDDALLELSRAQSDTLSRLSQVAEDLANLIVERFPVDPLKSR